MILGSQSRIRALSSFVAGPVPGSRALKGVTSERNVELANYQQQLASVRAQYRRELAGQLSGKQMAKIQRKKKSAESEAQWKAHLEEIRQTLCDPKSVFYRDRHPCRPIVDHAKNDAERLERRSKFSGILLNHTRIRRAYVNVISECTNNSFLAVNEHAKVKIADATRQILQTNQSPEEMINDGKVFPQVFRRHLPEIEGKFTVSGHQYLPSSPKN